MRDNEIAKGSENISQNFDAQPNFNHQELQQAAANNMVSERAAQGSAVDSNGQIDFSKHQLNGFDNSAGKPAGNSNAEANGMQPASGSSSENPQQAGSEAHSSGKNGAGDAAASGTSGNDSLQGKSGSGEVLDRKNGSADGSTKAESGESLNHKNSAADGSGKAGFEDAVKQSGSSASSASNEGVEAGNGGRANAPATMEATGASPNPKAVESEGGGGGKSRAMKEAEGNAVKTQETTGNSPQSGGAMPFGVSGSASATSGSGRPSW